MIPTVLLICAIVFGLMRMIPGDAVDIIVNRMTQSGQTVDEAAIRERLGLDVPAVQQFFNWMGNVLRGDLVDSFFQYDSVWNIIKRQLPISLELGVITLILANLISIPIGLFCAAKQDSIPDYVIRIIAVVLMAIPMFWLATLVLFYPAQWWGYAPPVVYVSFFDNPIANLQMFLVPALLGAFAQAGMQLRTVRTVVLDTMRQDYIHTAYAKGVKQSIVLFKHAFRNAMIPVITIIGGSRMVRSSAISVKDSGYCRNSDLLGGNVIWKCIKHVVPNIMPLVIISAAGSLGGVVMMEASMNFLGYGVDPGTPSWGALITGAGRDLMFTCPWMCLVPGIAIAILTFSANMFGDAIRDLLAPRLKGGVGSYNNKKLGKTLAKLEKQAAKNKAA